MVSTAAQQAITDPGVSLCHPQNLALTVTVIKWLLFLPSSHSLWGPKKGGGRLKGMRCPNLFHFIVKVNPFPDDPLTDSCF